MTYFMYCAIKGENAARNMESIKKKFLNGILEGFVVINNILYLKLKDDYIQERTKNTVVFTEKEQV